MLYEKLRQASMPMKMVQKGNAGENKKLQARCDEAVWKLNIQFEYTVMDKPQQNHLAELDFKTIAGKTREMMSHAS